MTQPKQPANHTQPKPPADPLQPKQPAAQTQPKQPAFAVDLEVFSGPFDLLLGLISKRELDITQVALAQVTDEFLAYMRAFPNLSATSDFLVVAATLLDMKARSLLPDEPTGEEEEDLEFLAARDLLFARLLEYRAYKEVAQIQGALLERGARYHARSVPLEPKFAQLLPQLRWEVNGPELAVIAAEVLTRQPERVTLTHLHDPLVPVGPQAQIIVEKLAAEPQQTFTQLCADAPDLNTVVSRFLALLNLYRERVVWFEQAAALEPLHVHLSSGRADKETTWLRGMDEFG